MPAQTGQTGHVLRRRLTELGNTPPDRADKYFRIDDCLVAWGLLPVLTVPGMTLVCCMGWAAGSQLLAGGIV